MKIGEFLRGLRRKDIEKSTEVVPTTSQSKKPVVEPKNQPEHTTDPVFAAAYKRLAERSLLGLYTKPDILTSLGALLESLTGYQETTKELGRMMMSDFGVVTPLVRAGARIMIPEIASMAAQREYLRAKFLSLVPEDQRVKLEGSVLVQARGILIQELQKPDIDQHYRTGAELALNVIGEHLTTRVAPGQPIT